MKDPGTIYNHVKPCSPLYIEQYESTIFRFDALGSIHYGFHPIGEESFARERNHNGEERVETLIVLEGFCNPRE